MTVPLPRYELALPPRFVENEPVTVAPVAEWAGSDDGTRPVVCTYHDGTGLREWWWTPLCDRLVGRPCVVVEERAGANGFPLVSDGESGWTFHPGTLRPGGGYEPPPACACDTLAVLMVTGCRCGAFQAEQTRRRP